MNDSDNKADKYLSTKQLSNYIGFSVGTIRNKVSRGDDFIIPYYAGNRMRFKLSDADLYLARRRKR